jgi:hypothetical protein
MKYKVTFISIFITFLFFQSCSDSFFDTPPIASTTEGSFYSSLGNLETATIGCYSQLGAVRSIDLNFVIGMGSIASDDADCGGSDPTDTQELQNLDRMLHQPSDVTTLRRIWGYLYKGIYFCNMSLKYFPDLKEGQSDEVQEWIDTRIGEVKFLRAMYYFMLCQAYGGVPLLDEPASLDELTSIERSTVKEVYGLIEQDLRDAIPVLPVKSQLDDVGRASKGAAQALLAKMLLYESSYNENYGTSDVRLGAVEDRYDEALQYAEEVISSGQYRLVGIDGDTYDTYWGAETNGYRYAFTEDGDNCEESVFEIQHINGPQDWIQARGNALTAFTTNRRYVNLDDEGQEFGWGFNCPTDDLMAEYEAGDPRIATVAAQFGDSILVNMTIDGNPVDMWRPIDTTVSPTNRGCRKYEASPEQYWSTRSHWADGPVNVRLIRYADVILMAAEAAFKEGDAATATTYVNMIRTRARMCGGAGNTVPADFTSNVTWEQLISERRRELACEGHRFWDLVRWGIAEQELDGHLLGIGYTVQFESPKYDFFPIPLTEVDRVPTLEQYQGWR